MNTSIDIEIPHTDEQNSFISSLYLRRKLLVLCFGVFGFVLPMIYGFAEGFPVPYIHDEFSFMLMADTFASGRITNPMPQFYEHFESPHIMLTPSYTSKYMPMQSLFLAAGQVLFGHQIFGVWLSCGLGAAALFWMLLAWTRFKWAFLGTVLFILFVGINSYWAQSYWGGMVAMAGGALFFGGFRRLFEKLSYGSALIMTIGGVILINSRSFEGLMTMLPALFVLLIWLLKDKKNSYAKKFLRVILPGALLTVITLSSMAYYNFRVTGNALRFSYIEHQSQYHPAALFIFQSPFESATNGHPRLRKLYSYLSVSNPIRNLKLFDLPDSIYLYPIYGFTYLLIFIPYFLLSPPLMIFFYLTAFVSLRKEKWSALMFGTILFTFLGMSLSIAWDNYHYAASLTCCFYFLILQGFELFITQSKKGFERKLVAVLLTCLVLASFIYHLAYMSTSFMPLKDSAHDDQLLTQQLTANEPIKIQTTRKITYIKPDIEKIVEKLPGKFITIVSYDKEFTFLDEIVFNKADIENSKLIWAYDLGEEKNKALLNYYSDRKILRINISDSKIEFIPEASNKLKN